MPYFDSTEHIGKGTEYKNAPPSVKTAANEALALPASIRAKTLPAVTLRDLCTMPIPSFQTKTALDNDLITQFFSSYEPDRLTVDSITKLQYLTMPERSVAYRIYELAHQAWLDGKQSIRYAHLDTTGNPTVTRFPLYIASLWKESAEIFTHRARWTQSSEYVAKQMNQKKRAVCASRAKEAWEHMNRLPWSVPIGILDDNTPIHCLYRLVGPNWLSSTIINAGLELLAERARDKMGFEIRVELCEFVNVLVTQHRARDKQAYRHGWLQGVGDAVCMESHTLATIVNLGKVNGEPHWVPFIISGETKKVHYGDSLNKEVPPALRACVDWWLHQHDSSSYTWVPLPIATQVDTYNCGILALDALTSFVDPSRPLVEDSPRALADCRLKLFVDIADRIEGRMALEGHELDDDEVGAFDGNDDGGLYDDTFEEQASTMGTSEFTFSVPLASRETDADVPYNSPTTKRTRHDAHAPTPNPSPRKKRIHQEPDQSIPLSLLHFAPLPSTTAGDPFATEDFEDMPILQDVDASDNEDGSDTDGDDDDNDNDNNNDEDDGNEAMDDIGEAMGKDVKASPKKSPDAKETGEILAKPSIKPFGSFKFRLTDLWKKESVTETNKRRADEGAKREMRRDQIAESEKEEALKKLTHTQALGRERQQRLRDRKRKTREEEGWTPKRGNFKKSKIVLLEESSNNDNLDFVTAEISRPRRQYKEDRRQAKKFNGRTRIHTATDATRVNWAQPFLFRQIDAAAKATGKPWSPLNIVRHLQKVNPKEFASLKPQVVGRWICSVGKARGESKWSDEVLARVKRGNRPGGETTRTGILSAYPGLIRTINTRLRAMRKVGVPLTTLSVRGIMVSYINAQAPHLFDIVQSDQSKFRCSEAFVKKYMDRHLGWSYRRATKTAKKLPDNLDEILTEAFLREANMIRTHAIPAALRVNTDQTQVVYQQGSETTWSEKGAKQVPTSGHGEKRAFTLVPSISASGVLLPMQAVYCGQSNLSLPSKKCAAFAEAKELGVRVVASQTKTYWSNHKTMHDLVDNIIAPYFDATKKELDLPDTQYALWKIDCWSVHKSKDFMDWMRAHHPRIIVLFVPGNCTSVWQPLDVGMQRVMKLAMKRACHRDIVDEVTRQLEVDPESVKKLDNGIATLRDRSLGWIVAAIRDTDDKVLIQKAFELCTVNGFNCSQTSLTSQKALEMLDDLPETNPTLFVQLARMRNVDLDALGEEELFSSSAPDDDSDVSLEVAADIVQLGEVGHGFGLADDGSLQRVGIAETDDEDIVRVEKGDEVEPEPVLELPAMSRRGRTIKPNRWYQGKEWQRS